LKPTDAPPPAPDPGALEQVRTQLSLRAAEHDREGSFPTEGFEILQRAGLLTATVAPRYQGPGAGLGETVGILRGLGGGDPAVALVTAMTLFLHAAQARHGHWPEPVYEELVAEAAHRPVLLNHLRVEPELGTPARGGLPVTTAVADGEGWRLNGRKIFSTGAVGLRWMLVWARTQEARPRVGSFLVRTDSPGITVHPTWDHLGLRASRSDDVVFEDVRVPAGHTTGLSTPEEAPGRDPLTGAWSALGLTALYLGVAGAARDWLTGFLSERVPSSLGAPLATLPRFQDAVGEIEVSLSGANALVDALARRIDEGEEEAVAQAGAAKVLGTRAAIGAVEKALSLTGNKGLTGASPLQRHYRDVLCSRVHTPQDDSVLSAAGRAALARHSSPAQGPSPHPAHDPAPQKRKS
jgi:alkylation response protein AidB-like acyl-CoA dehydrogenase